MFRRKIAKMSIYLTLILLLLLPLSLKVMQHKSEKFKFVEYTVQPGDTLWSIAGEFNQPGKDVRELIYNIRKVNDISPVIHPGQVVLVPVK